MKKNTMAMIGMIIFVIGLAITIANFGELSVNLPKMVGTVLFGLFAFRYATIEYCVKEEAEN